MLTRARQSRRAALLIAPALLVLAIVIGYPVVRAIWLSFQADKGLDPATGMFVDGGFAGIENYLYWLTQRCMGSGGLATTCPPGVLATDFWPAVRITLFFTVVTVTLETVLGMVMALIMAGNYRGRGLARAAAPTPSAIPRTAPPSRLRKCRPGSSRIRSTACIASLSRSRIRKNAAAKTTPAPKAM